MEMTFKKGELMSIIAESSQEFKAKLGPGVESNDKKNNKEAYTNAEKRAKDYDGGLNAEVGEKRVKYEKDDYNGTTLDYYPENVDDAYRERVKAQALGYTSKLEKDNKLPKTGNYDGNKDIYDAIKKSGEQMNKDREAECLKGLVGRTRDKEYFKKERMTENVKTIRFKKTEFLSEEHMISRIPDEFKVDGNVFRMKDKNDNEYLLEWNGRANILEHTNKKGFENSMNDMKRLMSYDPATRTTSTSSRERLDENDDTFRRTLNIVRGKQANN